MSGHSKWSQIKRKKGLKDKQKGNIFSKMSRLLTLAVIQGGGITDPQNNVRLRFAIDKAKSFNMPKDNIERAIEKGAGDNAQSLTETDYEAFSHEGIAILIVAATDNPNRTTSEVRNVLERFGAKLGHQGSVLYLFKKMAWLRVDKNEITEDGLYKFAEKIAAFDIDQDEEAYYVYYPFENLTISRNILPGLSSLPEIIFRPQTSIPLDQPKLERLLNLVDELESMDDVQGVFHNGTVLKEEINVIQ